MPFRTIAVLHYADGFRNSRKLRIRRDGSQLDLRLATGDDMALNLSYLRPFVERDPPPAFAKGSDMDVITAVRAWVERGKAWNVVVDIAPDASGQGKPDTADDLLARAYELVRDARGTVNGQPQKPEHWREQAALTGSFASALRAIQQARDLLAAVEAEHA